MSLVLLLSLSAAAPVAGESPAELVQRLGSPSFTVREGAAVALRKLGAAAEPALRAGLKDADPDVRTQCRDLLDEVNRDLRETRLAAFLEDREDSKTPLPGWKRFRALFTGDPPRKAFAAFYRANADLLDSLDRAPAEVAPHVAELASRLTGFALLPDHDAESVAQTFLLLFLASDTRLALPLKTADALTLGLEVVARREELRKLFLRDGSHRKVLLGYLQQHREPPLVDGALALAEEFRLADASDWALRLATDKDRPLAVRARALLTLAQIGGKKDLAAVAPLLENTSFVGERKVGKLTLRTELRDVALGASLRLSGGCLADGGFPYLELLPGLETVPAPTCLGFPDAASRAAAFQKFAKRGAPEKRPVPPGTRK
jgi:hypothetical protein